MIDWIQGCKFNNDLEEESVGMQKPHPWSCLWKLLESCLPVKQVEEFKSLYGLYIDRFYQAVYGKTWKNIGQNVGFLSYILVLAELPSFGHWRL